MVSVALYLGTVMQSGGGAFGLAGITKGGCGVWLQLLDDDAAPVPGAWALFRCASVSDCDGCEIAWRRSWPPLRVQELCA